jgi:hypothetical protein
MNLRAAPLLLILLLGMVRGATAVTFNTDTVFQTGSGQVSFIGSVSTDQATVNDTWVMFNVFTYGGNALGNIGFSAIGCNIQVTEASPTMIRFTATVPGLLGLVRVYAPGLATPTGTGGLTFSVSGKTAEIMLLFGNPTVTLTYTPTAQDTTPNTNSVAPDFDLRIQSVDPDPAPVSSHATATAQIISLGVSGEVEISYWVQKINDATHLYEGSTRIYTSQNGNYTVQMSFKAPAEPGNYLFCYRVDAPIVSNVISHQFAVSPPDTMIKPSIIVSQIAKSYPDLILYAGLAIVILYFSKKRHR